MGLFSEHGEDDDIQEIPIEVCEPSVVVTTTQYSQT